MHYDMPRIILVRMTEILLRLITSDMKLAAKFYFNDFH